MATSHMDLILLEYGDKLQIIVEQIYSSENFWADTWNMGI